AFSAEPSNVEALRELLRAASRAGRTADIADAVLLALRSDTWPLEKPTARTVPELKAWLYRAAFNRRIDLIARQLSAVTRSVNLGSRGQVSEAEFLPILYRQVRDSMLFALTDALVQPGQLDEKSWSVDYAGVRLTV